MFPPYWPVVHLLASLTIPWPLIAEAGEVGWRRRGGGGGEAGWGGEAAAGLGRGEEGEREESILVVCPWHDARQSKDFVCLFVLHKQSKIFKQNWSYVQIASLTNSVYNLHVASWKRSASSINGHFLALYENETVLDPVRIDKSGGQWEGSQPEKSRAWAALSSLNIFLSEPILPIFLPRNFDRSRLSSCLWYIFYR